MAKTKKHWTEEPWKYEASEASIKKHRKAYQEYMEDNPTDNILSNMGLYRHEVPERDWHDKYFKKSKRKTR